MPKRGLAGAAERREIIAGMIGGAREWTCGDEKEALGEAPLPIGREFCRRYVALDGQHDPVSGEDIGRW